MVVYVFDCKCAYKYKYASLAASYVAKVPSSGVTSDGF